jgi:hypothetical protein
MNNFTQLVQEWQIFYATIATASATLAGLLFVAMSLNVGMFARSENIGLKKLAIQTLTSFLFIIIFALIFLIPRQDRFGLGIPLMCNGIAGLITTISHHRILFSNIPRGISRRKTCVRAAMTLVAFMTLIIVSFMVMVRASTSSLYWLVAPMILLLTSASLSTWALLIRVREASVKKRE